MNKTKNNVNPYDQQDVGNIFAHIYSYICHINVNNLNLGNLNKTELSRKNRSCINNIIVPIPKIKTEKIAFYYN